MTTPKAIALLLVGASALAGGPRPGRDARASGPCYVALLHGSGPDLSDRDPRSAEMERYWNPAGDPARSLAAEATSPERVSGRCVTAYVGYDGGVEWWHVRAAGRAARSIGEFIDAHHIPDGGLILIGHSMGGLVARYIVNNGAPEAPYYNEYAGDDARMDYDLVRRKTSFIVTVDAPHTGTEAADALSGDADHAFSNRSVAVLKAVGVARDSAANTSLTRAYMEAAGAPGGEMADEGREVPILTVAGISPAAARAGSPTRADRRLELAWSMLCGQPGALNLWGLACDRLLWNRHPVAGDGIVSRGSAHGFWTRAPPGHQSTIAGAYAAWLDRRENHSEGRYTAQASFLVDLVAHPGR